jgi:hypothetical protein
MGQCSQEFLVKSGPANRLLMRLGKRAHGRVPRVNMGRVGSDEVGPGRGLTFPCKLADARGG